MKPTLRTCLAKDMNFLLDIDIKSYQYPWSAEQWGAANDSRKFTRFCIELDGRPVGFVILEICRHTGTGSGIIKRLAVLPACRGLGAGSKLLKAADAAARIKELGTLEISVPELNCFPGHPDDVSEWLMARGFRAVPPVKKKGSKMYGQWVDHFTFEKELRDA